MKLGGEERHTASSGIELRASRSWSVTELSGFVPVITLKAMNRANETSQIVAFYIK